MNAGRIIHLLLIATAAITLAACGSEEGFPPPAEPGVAPEVTTEPAGVVLDIGPGEAEGVISDPLTGITAVATRDPDRLFLVTDPLTDNPGIRRVQIPESPRHMQLARPGGPVITTAERTDDLIEVSLPTGDVRTVKVGDFPHDATASLDGERIFVADEGADTISVVSGPMVTDTLPAPEQPGGIAAASPSGMIGTIAVAERVLALYDPETLEKTGQVDAGVGPTHLVAGDDDRFYVADTQGDAILIFEAAPELRFLDRVNVPDKPYGIAIDNRNGYLWVTQTDRNRVIQYELTELAPKRIASFPTVRQPNTVSTDPRSGLVYVAGRAEGELQVFDPEEEN